MLAIGIGANIAAFGFLNLIVLRPLPVRDPGHAAAIRTPRARTEYATDLPYAEMAFVRDARRRRCPPCWPCNGTRLVLERRGQTGQRAFRDARTSSTSSGPQPLLGRVLDPGRRRHARCRARRGPESRLLAAAVRRQSRRWSARSMLTERQAGDGRRRGRRRFQWLERRAARTVWAPLWPPSVLRRGQQAA